jgi:myo-inositol 2-dehydrogenase/D-chiro-inositol 1-dehydrogenase
VGNPAKLKNPAKQVTRVFATGLNTVYPELEAQGDCDNAIGVIEFENGTKFNIHLSRTSMHGHDVICEVFGTESKLVINEVSGAGPLLLRKSTINEITHPVHCTILVEVI